MEDWQKLVVSLLVTVLAGAVAGARGYARALREARKRGEEPETFDGTKFSQAVVWGALGGIAAWYGDVDVATGAQLVAEFFGAVGLSSLVSWAVAWLVARASGAPSPPSPMP